MLSHAKNIIYLLYYETLSPHAIILSFIAGIAASLAVGATGSLWPSGLAGAAAVISLAALFLQLGKSRAGDRGLSLFFLLLAAFISLGLFSGLVRIRMLEQSALALLEGKRLAAIVTVTSPVVEKDARLRFTGQVESVRWRDRSAALDETVLVELSCRGECQAALAGMQEGARFSADAIAGRPQSTPGSDFDYGEYLRRRGIQVVLEGDAGSAQLLPEGRGGLAGLVDGLRRHSRESLGMGQWGNAGELLKGMVLGDDQGVPDDVISDFQGAGLLHMLAVSGQNVALLGFIILFLLQRLLVPRLTAVAIAIGVIAIYIPLTGGGPSIVRAGIVGILGMAAMVFARQSDRYHFLELSAAAILFLSPYSLLDPGFQLSYAAVLAIFFVAPVLEELIRFCVPRLPGLLAQGLAISTATGLATAPITLADFGQVSLVTVPANIAAEPVAGPVMMLGVLAILTEPVLPLLTWVLVTVASACTGYIIVLAHLMASLPGAVYRSGSPGLAATSGFYAMLIGIVITARRMGVSATLIRIRAARGLLVPLVLLLALLVGLSCASGGTATGPPPVNYRVSFLDVGQGDATLIQVPPSEASAAGVNILIDGGPGSQVVERLRESGVTRLDAVYLTHPHADHVAGLVDVLGAFPTAAVFDAAAPSSSQVYLEFLRLIEQQRIPYHIARRGQAMDFGELHLDVLNPGDDLKSDDLNADSLVIMARYRGLDILIPGDAEGETLAGLDLPLAAVYKVPHHGSRDAAISRVLSRVRPRAAVISVGEGNSYGHPADSTVAALEKAGAGIYRTDRQGTITVTLAGGEMEVATRR